MCEVWNAPATFSGMTRALAGGFSARALSCSKVPAATVWPAPLTLAGVAPAASMAASTSAGSPPTTALMPVGVTAAAAAMLLARSRTNVMASVLGQDTGQGRGRDLADGVAGEDDRKRAEFDVEQGLRGHQPGGDDQGLRDGGVLDGFLIGGGAVGGEVDACDFAQGGQMACDGRQFQPRGQKTRGLGALSRADDCKHVTSFPNYRVIHWCFHAPSSLGQFVGSLQRFR